MVDKHDADDSKELPEPIKVKWQGDSRVKYETRTLEPLDSDASDAARRANARHKTQITIKTEMELDGTIDGLESHNRFCGEVGAAWGSRSKRKAAKRVRDTIVEQAEAMGVL